MSRKTTTALAFSLGDVLKKGYFVEPPYEVISGTASEAPADAILKESLAKDRSVIVLGEPGSGKSTIVAKVFLDCAKAFVDSHSDSIPLHVNLRGRGAFYHFTGMQFIEDCCAQFFHKLLPPLFDMSKVRPIYFMDGLDELTEDVTALNMDQVAEKDLLIRPFVISCRSRFAEDSLVSHRFGERVDIVIRMTDWRPEQTWEYIKKFCRIRGKPELLVQIEQAYKESKDLAELLHNPLLLTLFLWVVEESGMALPLGVRDRTSVLREVIRLLVNREMGRSRMTDLSDRANVERTWKLAAWETYRARLEDEDMTIAQLQERVAEFEATAVSFTGLPLFLDLLDTNPHSGYVRGMVHEVLWEYLVGSAIADGVKENRYPFPKCLQYVNRVEINRFVRELWARETMETQRQVLGRLKDAFARDVISQDRYANLRRSHAVYYIGRLPLKGIVDELRALAVVEADIMVKLSISFGLVKLGDLASEEQLWQRLDTDKTWDAYNRGYHLVYYRDWSAMRNLPPYIDHGTAPWDRTFAALYRHLTSDEPKHVALRRIELLTMRRFIETRHAAGPLAAKRMDEIRISMKSTPDPIVGFRDGVLRELERLLEVWKSVTA